VIDTRCSSQCYVGGRSCKCLYKPERIRWLIDYLLLHAPLKNFSFIWKCHHYRWRATKFRPMLGPQGLLRNLYRATPAVTPGLGFSVLIRMTSPFSRLLCPSHTVPTRLGSPTWKSALIGAQSGWVVTRFWQVGANRDQPRQFWTCSKLSGSGPDFSKSELRRGRSELSRDQSELTRG
jgi:hypothetical protein